MVVAAWGRPDFLEELRGRLDTLPGNDIVVGAFDRLVESKRRRHAADDRAVGNWELRLKATDLSRSGRKPGVDRRTADGARRGLTPFSTFVGEVD